MIQLRPYQKKISDKGLNILKELKILYLAMEVLILFFVYL